MTDEYEGPDKGMHDTEILDNDDTVPIFVIVPEEPSDAMLRAGYQAFIASPSASFAGRIPYIYAAMISAAPAENRGQNLRREQEASLQPCGCISFPSPVRDHCIDCYFDRGGQQQMQGRNSYES